MWRRNPPNTAHASLTFMRFRAVTFHIYNTQRSISVPIPELYDGYLQKGILVHSLHTDTADFTDLNPTLTCPIHLRLLKCEWSHYQTNTSAIVQPNTQSCLKLMPLVKPIFLYHATQQCQLVRKLYTAPFNNLLANSIAKHRHRMY